jgi:hypothetical protein
MERSPFASPNHQISNSVWLGIAQASRLILRPNRPYNADFRSCISSLSSLIFSSRFATSVSIFSTEDVRSSWTSGTERLKKVSPILYLPYVSIIQRTTSDVLIDTGLSHPRRPTPAPWRSLRGLLCPSKFVHVSTSREGLIEWRRTCLVFSSSWRALERE